MIRTPLFRAATACLVSTGATLVFAQTPADPTVAAQRYEQQLAACNSGSLPAPAREACIRNAGSALDRARGGPPADTEMTTPDGRATVVAPAGAVPPVSASDTRTSGDGRATIVLPADRTAPR